MTHTAPLRGSGLQNPQQSKAHVFATLDGLRGVAALAVILFHLPGMLGPLRVPHGYLAVDFFFLLSGFVLAYAYGERLDGGWSTRSFLLVRLIRLYPVYALCMVAAFAVTTLPLGYQGTFGSPGRMAARLALALCFIPSFVSDMWLFPLNFPSWSILLEAAGNVGHALLLRRRSNMVFAVIAAAAAVGTAWSAVRVGHMNFGAIRPFASLAVFRLVFGYVGGILLYRVRKRRRYAMRASGAIAVVLVCGVFALPASLPHLPVVDLICALVVLPCLVLLAACSHPGPRLARFARLLGALSYPVYLLHMPLFFLFAALWAHASGKHADPSAAMGAVFLPTLLLLSWAASIFFDAPLRAWLTRTLQRHLV